MQEDKLLSQGEKKDTITHFVPEIYLVKEQIQTYEFEFCNDKIVHITKDKYDSYLVFFMSLYLCYIKIMYNLAQIPISCYVTGNTIRKIRLVVNIDEKSSIKEIVESVGKRYVLNLSNELDINENEDIGICFSLKDDKIIESFLRNRKNKLTLYIRKSNDTFVCKFFYNTMSFSDNDIKFISKSLLQRWIIYLEDLFLPIKKVCNDNFLEKKILKSVNYELDIQSKHIYDIFKKNVVKNASSVAISENGIQYLYSELNERIDQFYYALQSVGIGKKDSLGICVNKVYDFVVAAMSSIRIGIPFVPIDSDCPEMRIKLIINESNIKYLIISDDMKRLQAIPQSIFFSNMEGEIEGGGQRGSKGQIIYTIFTSGSTGNPKGVKVRHEGFLNYIEWAKNYYSLGEKFVFPYFTSFGFDLSLTSIFVPLLSGGEIISYLNVNKEFALQEIIKQDKVNIIKLTPAHLEILNWLDIKSNRIKKIIVGGEKFQTELARSITDKLGLGIEIYNEYGPTETTVGCTIHKYDYEKDNRYTVPIGCPIDNMSIYLDLGKKHDIPGAVGEICVSGIGVAKGYINSEDDEQERFDEAKHIYKTGDLGRFLSNGLIEFVGRKDSQVKIRGFRIETDEIDIAIMKEKEVVFSKTVKDKDTKQLYSYVVVNSLENTQDIERRIKAVLNEKLPDYMHPLRIIFEDKIVCNQNGKFVINNNKEREKERDSDFSECSRLVKAIFEILMIDEGEYDNDFEDRDLIAYNLDSLVAVQIIIWMEKEFGIEIDLEKLEMDNLKSIKNMRDFLKEYNIII